MRSSVFLGALACGVLAGYARAETRTFTRPTFNGDPVDFCYLWRSRCGQDAANVFCRGLGFEGALAFRRADSIEGFRRTRALGDGAVCEVPHCLTFEQVTCRGPTDFGGYTKGLAR